MSVRVLDQRTLNRALLARQLLLERATLDVPAALEQVAGLQTQYAPSGYVGLWTRVAGFERDDLTRALEDRSAVQATLMRTTIHLVSRRDFWRFALGVRRARREWAARVRTLPATDELAARSDRLRAALEAGPRSVGELDGLAAGFIGTLSLWVDLVRVPPSGTWERRRADRLALAEAWVGPEDATEAEGLVHLVRAYLHGFGPAAWRDISGWAGIPVADVRRAAEGLTLVRYRDTAGRELVDLADERLPDAGTPAPVRFLPHFDNTLWVHARRTGILPEHHRARVFSVRTPSSVGTILVDGQVAATWTARAGRIVVEHLEELSPADLAAVEREREALEAFSA
ncbi:MAG TPA: winged helix DNA-binding domain-containing protein [Candidatus Limnocylindrales bacterium]|nr:winged helix DNA-binding domain-containing protein [Candidatus Limnocylindrales bacterium]